MADLASNIRLAVDSGEVALGIKSVSSSIVDSSAKLVIAASKGNESMVQDVQHMAKVAEVKFMLFEGNSMDLGRVCGKPYSVSVLSVIQAGNSNILEEPSAAPVQAERKQEVEATANPEAAQEESEVEAEEAADADAAEAETEEEDVEEK